MTTVSSANDDFDDKYDELVRICCDPYSEEAVIISRLDSFFTANRDVMDTILNRPNKRKIRNWYKPLLLTTKEYGVRWLLDHGANMDYQDQFGMTALSHACRNCGHYDQAKLLLKYGANVNHQDSKGKSPIYYALYDGNLPICRLLLEHGSNIEIEDNQGNTPFANAIKGGAPEIVVGLMLDYGANIDYQTSERRCRTPLCLATSSRRYAVVRLLLDRMANINIQDPHTGCTPLIISCKYKLGMNFDEKLGTGIEFFVLKERETKRNVELIQLLLERGAKVECKDNDGRTALWHAVAHKNSDAVYLLVRQVVEQSGVVPLIEQITSYEDFLPLLPSIDEP
jgi:ankyrin repeat protein